MANYSGYDKKETIKLYKRFGIVLICCFPVLVLMAYFLLGNLHSILQIFIYCVIVAVVFIIEEMIYSAKKEQRERLKEEAHLKKDKN